MVPIVEKPRPQFAQLIFSCNSAAGLFRIGPRSISAGSGVAIREAPLKGDEADYLLFADEKASSVFGFEIWDAGEGNERHHGKATDERSRSSKKLPSKKRVQNTWIQSY